MGRVLALDHGAARCGCAVSDPSGTVVTPLAVIERPDTRRGLTAVVRLAGEQDAERVLVGLPLTLAGEEGAQAAEARAFAERLGAPAAGARGPVRRAPDHTAGRAQRGARGTADSRAAAHLLEAYLARTSAGLAE